MQVRQMSKPPSDLNNTQVMPNPVLEKRTRRQFSADFKLRIIAEVDACKHAPCVRLVVTLIKSSFIEQRAREE